MNEQCPSNEIVRRIRRTCEMSAGIMRDTQRTGAWEGAEKVARQFDRLAELAAQLETTAPEPAQPLTTLSSPRSALWTHMHDEHGLTLLVSELDEIERLAKACSADEPGVVVHPADPKGTQNSATHPGCEMIPPSVDEIVDCYRSPVDWTGHWHGDPRHNPLLGNSQMGWNQTYTSQPPASEPRALQRYAIRGRLMPLSENGIQQLTVVGEASHDVYLCADVDGAAQPPASEPPAAQVSRLCSEGKHDWCMNRSAEESSCRCNCHAQRASQPPVPALRDVVAERERQKSVEGWTPEHDDEHEGGALAVAGAAYAYYAAWHRRDRKNSDRPPQLDSDEILTSLWPFDEEWWKPKDPRRDLVRAAALILAELERLDRATATKGGDQS